MKYQAPELVLVGAAQNLVQADPDKKKFRDNVPVLTLSRDTSPL